MKLLQDLSVISDQKGRGTCSDESSMGALDSSQPPLALVAMICATTSSSCLALQSFSNAGLRYDLRRDQSAATPEEANAAGPGQPASKNGARNSSDSEQPKFEMDFNQQGSDSARAKTIAAEPAAAPVAEETPAAAAAAAAAAPAPAAPAPAAPAPAAPAPAAAATAPAGAPPPQLQFESPAGIQDSVASPATTTRDDGESSSDLTPTLVKPGLVAASAGSSEKESAGKGASDEEEDEEEIQTELEGESHQMPPEQFAAPRILTHPAGGQKKQRQDIVFGKLSVMVSEVSEDALVLPLRSQALGDLLERRHTYRAIALRCGCELVLTRRVVVRRMVKWVRYAVLLLRGPSDAALKRFRAQLEAANVAFRLASPYDAGQSRPRLLTSERLPDNLALAVCAERTGRATTAWERLPLEMPQRKQGKPLYGPPKNLILPNNAAIGKALGHLYPGWGFQGSKPIPHTHTFEAAVVKAQELEKQQEAELRQRSSGAKD